jgi:hypothetical protein
MAKRSTKKQLAPHVPTPLQPETVVILYHQRTGVISHTHFFSVANGGKLPGREELERVALAHPRRSNRAQAWHGLPRGRRQAVSRPR